MQHVDLRAVAAQLADRTDAQWEVVHRDGACAYVTARGWFLDHDTGMIILVAKEVTAAYAAARDTVQSISRVAHVEHPGYPHPTGATAPTGPAMITVCAADHGEAINRARAHAKARGLTNYRSRTITPHTRLPEGLRVDPAHLVVTPRFSDHANAQRILATIRNAITTT